MISKVTPSFWCALSLISATERERGRRAYEDERCDESSKSAAAFGAVNIRRVFADVYRVADTGDSDHGSQDARSLSASGRDTCASSQLRNFSFVGGRRRPALRAAEPDAAKFLRIDLRREHGVDLRRIRDVAASRRQLLATREFRRSGRYLKYAWFARIRAEVAAIAGASFRGRRGDGADRGVVLHVADQIVEPRQ